MEYPKLIALDTNGTIWEKQLGQENKGKGWGVTEGIEDNIQPVNCELQDRNNHENPIRIYGEISDVIGDILKHGALIAILSNNTTKSINDRALSHFVAADPRDGSPKPLIQLARYNETTNESKVEQFRRIWEMSGLDYSEMILFDDEAMNNAVRIRLGVTFQLIYPKKGLTWDIYQKGLDAWRRVKMITIYPNPNSKPIPMLIGYTGQSRVMIELVRRGEARVHKMWTCRWGFGLYVTDHPRIAKFYSDWEKREGREGWVCEVWVKDYDTWVNGVKKVWIPENDTRLPQMNNRRTTEEETGQNQEDRDCMIAERWGVQTPYVLFSRHRFLNGMPTEFDARSNELLIPTQIQRSLVYLTEITETKAEQAPIPFLYHFQTQAWNITIPEETKQDFLEHREEDIYDIIMKV